MNNMKNSFEFRWGKLSSKRASKNVIEAKCKLRMLQGDVEFLLKKQGLEPEMIGKIAADFVLLKLDLDGALRNIEETVDTLSN